MRTCQENEVVFKAVPTHAQVGERTLQFDAFAGIPMIEFRGTPLDSWGTVFKRFFDIIGSVLATVVLSPVMLIISILIKLDSKGPVIYKNVRTGNKGDFKTLKFRTMFRDVCTGSEYGGSRAEKIEDKLIKEKNIKEGSAVYKIAEDPRVTRIGSFLRKTSLDELPQLFNVFIGNMSLVGPRPHQPKEVKNYSNQQRKLLLIKPGITGLAQISGRSDLSFDEEARLDIFYLENWSIWLDFYVIIRTFSAVLKGKGSY
jgi:exopolysaccharide biosynthesis polyprenyl glycosylphosphotransferase